MAALLCGSTPSGTQTQCTGKDNHDRLMALYHTGTDVKRYLLQYHLSQKNLDLADYLYGKYQFLQPDDIKRALRTKNIQLSDLGIYSIDTLLSDQCFDLFWDSCLDKDKTSLENILNRYKEHLYSLYKTSGRDNNGSARNPRKREYLSKKQWECLYKGPEDIKENDVQLSQLSLTFPNKGLTIQSFDDDIHFVLLSNVCPLYQSLQVVTTNQIKLSRIAVEHEINNETFDEIWKLVATHLKPISSYCICETHFDHKLDWIKKGTFKCIQAQENRKLILESTFDNKAFSEDAEFMTRVQKELNLIETENTKDLVTKHCDKEIHVVLVHGQYIAGSYPLSIEKATKQDLESCQSVCSRQATDKKTLSSSRNIDVLEEQKSIDRHSYLKFVCLIQDVAKNVLVGVLKRRLPGANFGNTLNGMKKRLLPFLNSNQEQLVYPDGLKYAGDLTDMDVSLLYIILRNLGTICPHQNGWGKEPEEHDNSISANIDRIRMAKNMIVSHSSNCSLGYDEFNNQWETIRRCCVELGGEQCEEIIDTLLTSTFNSDLEQQFSEKLENLKETEMLNERHCRKLEELLDSAKEILVNLRKEPVFRGRSNGTQYKEGTTPMILQIKSNSLPCKTEIEEKIGNYNNNDMHVTSVENGSIVIRLQMFSSAFQSFGYVLAVIDKLLQRAFPARSVSEDDIAVSIILSVDMHQFSEVNEGHLQDLTNQQAQGRCPVEEMIVFGLEKCETSKYEGVPCENQIINENRRSKEVSNDDDGDSENIYRFSKLSMVVIETFPNMLRDIIRSKISASQLYQMCQQHLNRFSPDQQHTLLALQFSNPYSSLDIPLSYRLLRQFSLIEPPTCGWGNDPDTGNMKLGDDVERIRRYRNQLAHRYSIHITKNEFDYFFDQFCNIGHRMDLNISHETHYETEIKGRKTCNMDIQMKTKYENSLKEIQHIQLRVHNNPIQLFWGNSFDMCLKNLRDEKAEGTRKIRIQMIFQGEDYMEQNIDILNSLKEKINKGLSGIEFIEATLERTESIPKKTKQDSELPFHVDLDIEANLLETDDRMVEELSNMSKVVLKNSVENKKHQNISATLLPSLETGYMEKLL